MPRYEQAKAWLGKHGGRLHTYGGEATKPSSRTSPKRSIE
jgi:hypothetical protein